MKKYLVVSLVLVFLVGAYSLVFADHCGTAMSKGTSAAESETHATNKALVDVGNKVCPVSGDKIDTSTKVTYEYEGKIYNFCCSGCIEPFKKDPQSYIKKVQEELKTVTPEVSNSTIKK